MSFRMVHIAYGIAFFQKLFFLTSSPNSGYWVASPSPKIRKPGGPLSLSWQPGCLREIRGFPSPDRSGFGFFCASSVQLLCHEKSGLVYLFVIDLVHCERFDDLQSGRDIEGIIYGNIVSHCYHGQGQQVVAHAAGVD